MGNGRPFLLVLALLAACGGGTEPSDLPGEPVGLEIVSGDGQVVTPGDTTPEPLVVRAVDSAGRSVGGVAVTFTVLIGPGSLVDGTDARTLLVQTSSEGLAEAHWSSNPAWIRDSAYIQAQADGLEPVEFLVYAAYPAPPVGRPLTAASNFSCRITNPIHCWGTLQAGLPPTRFSGSPPVAVDGFGGTMCAAVPHGRYCWGDNSSGQYGDGLATSYAEPHLVQDGFEFSALAIGGTFGCGIDRLASVWCWTKEPIDGIGSFPGSASGLPDFIMRGMSRLDAGTDFICGVSTKQRLACAGENAYGQLGSSVGAGGAVSFVDVAAGAYHACALAEDGIAWCWGRNDAGQLGDGSMSDRSARLAVSGGHRFTRLAAGARHTCGIATDGGAWCWGSNAHGQLGDESFDDSAVPVAVAGPRRFSELAAGSEHTCGISTEGETLCWGATELGQVPVDHVLDPLRIDDRAFAHLWGGAGKYCARSGAEVFCWDGSSFDLAPAAAGMESLAWSLESHCGIQAGGVAACWGSNEFGQLGSGSVGGSAAAPSPVTGGQLFTKIGVGEQHACALAVTRRIWCWGGNEYGQLGSGSAGTASGSPLEIAGNREYVDLAVGSHHGCAVTVGGSVECWGLNLSGRLGNGTEQNQATPTPIASSLTFASVFAVAPNRTCALTALGEAYCWGVGNEGTLGYVPTQQSNVCAAFVGTCSTTPGRVQADVRFRSLGGGDWIACGIATDGRTWCWGTHAGGLRGIRSGVPSWTPTLHPTDLEFESIHSVGFTACGRASSGSVHCWGDVSDWTAVYDFGPGVTFPLRF